MLFEDFQHLIWVLTVNNTVRSRWASDEESRVLWGRDGALSKRAFGWKQHSPGDQDAEAVTHGFERLGHVRALPVRYDSFRVKRVMQVRIMKGDIA